MSSVLNDTKQVLGVPKEAKEFDIDILMHINSAFFTLMQLGVGPYDGFTVHDETTEWSEFFSGRQDLNSVKSYVFIAVRLLFDRPETSYGIKALEDQKAEFAWRLELQSRIGGYE